MNPALSCIGDTLRLLLEESKEAKEAATAKQCASADGFDVGRSEALVQVLHTLANQLQTFGIETQLNGAWDELQVFLASQGY